MRKMLFVVLCCIMLLPVVAQADSFLGFNLPESLTLENGMFLDFKDRKISLAVAVPLIEFLDIFECTVGYSETDTSQKWLLGAGLPLKNLDKLGLKTQMILPKLLDIKISVFLGYDSKLNRESYGIFINIVSIDLIKLWEGEK